MNFGIIERGETEEFLQKFIDLYYDKNYSIHKICKMMDMSRGKYQRIRDELIKEGKIEKNYRSKPKRGKGKYYILNKKYGTYTVTRKFKGKQLYYMSVPTEEMAQYCVELFHQYGWDKKNVSLIKQRMMERFE